MTDADMPTASFVCECGRRFPSEMALQDHAREAHGALEPGETERLRCPECDTRLGSPDELRRHMLAHSGHRERHENRR